MNLVIALACADEPLAFSASLPPQSPVGADPVSPDPDVALLSLPHADNNKVPAANRLSAAPVRLAFTKLLLEKLGRSAFEPTVPCMGHRRVEQIVPARLET
jgi:hypothetical protein